MADEFAPFVVVNPKDSAAAMCFTLLHELAHLWVGEPGISGGDPMEPVEMFCNKTASSFLLADGELATFKGPARNSVDAWAAAIAAFAGPLNVSSSMVAYRLHLQAVIDRESWQGLRRVFRDHWLDGQRRQRQKRQEGDGGPTYGIRVRIKSCDVFQFARKLDFRTDWRARWV